METLIYGAVASAFGALLGIIGYMIKERFKEQQSKIVALEGKHESNMVEMGAIKSNYLTRFADMKADIERLRGGLIMVESNIIQVVGKEIGDLKTTIIRIQGER